MASAENAVRMGSVPWDQFRRHSPSGSRRAVLRQRFRARDDRMERVEPTVDVLDVRVLRRTRSGNRFAPVSRFHSSKVSFEILP
jgi:hypothetical protein